MSPLADLFSAGGHRFHLTLRRGEPGEFFRLHDASGRVLAERARWLADDPGRHAALRPEGVSLRDEFAALAEDWLRTARPPVADAEGAAAPARPASSLAELGARLEPDFLLLSPDEEGRFRLRGGAVCFPSGWALEEKLGETIDFIHGVVPGLNATLASPIQQFLSRLKPGVAYLRANWGLAATDELNLHPARRIAAPLPPVALAGLWLRVEHQALVALPRTGGIVFGIRIAVHRLDKIEGAADAAGLRRELETMSPEMAAYKGLDGIRDELVRLLPEE